MKCSDVNECEISSRNPCSEYATCTNNLGSFACDCNTGYESNGIECLDINECKIGDNCHVNAICTNTLGKR